MNSRLDVSSKEELEINEIKTDLINSAEASINLEFHSGLTEFHKSILNSSTLNSLGTQSAPNSPPSRRSRYRISVKSRVASLERNQFKFLLVEDNRSIMEAELKPLKAKRGAHKAWVTRTINEMKGNSDNYSPSLFKRMENRINVQIDKIEDIDLQIVEIYDKHGAKMTEDSDGSFAFISYIQSELDTFELEVKSKTTKENSGDAAPVNISNADLIDAITKSRAMPTKITLKCHNFDCNLKDTYQFKSWLNQF